MSKRKIIGIGILLLLATFFVTRTAQHSGFCVREMKVLTDRELVDRNLFGTTNPKSLVEMDRYMQRNIEAGLIDYNFDYKWDQLDSESKIKNYRDLRQKDPACCRVGSTPSYGMFATLESAVLWMRGLRYKSYSYLAQYNDGEKAYADFDALIDQCGNSTSSISKMPVTYEEFLTKRVNNKRFWSGAK